jgi:hypothetical protein
MLDGGASRMTCVARIEDSHSIANARNRHVH